ncbi:MAG: CDP-alcohol phosphatidyltransferase family protein [Myxococcales bacterium]|nr:CDP-alcohol phosphatidyltransferase family protein [Myxococcales bacterium]
MSKACEYKVVDQELLLGFYKKLLWDRILPHIPDRITPNAITVTGQVMVGIAVLLAYAATQTSDWLFPFSSLFLLGYLTADNLDGPHARRTGQSSPLGEFLDHGLDGLASGAVLICTALTLRVTGWWMVALCVLGSIGFIVSFWEQTRRGVLIIPEMGATEGITLLILMQTTVVLSRSAPWMSFNPHDFTNVATLIMCFVLFGYTLAIIPPVWRVAKARILPWEILPIIALTAPYMLFVLRGANPLYPSIAVSVYAANFVCRAITLRHHAREINVVRVTDAIALIPIFGLAGRWFPVDHWAALSMVLALMHYGVNLALGIRGLDPATKPVEARQ